MGYFTPNEEAHDCTYCTNIVESGQGVLLKYSKAQPDTEIIEHRLTYRVGHMNCVREHGVRFEKEALEYINAK